MKVFVSTSSDEGGIYRFRINDEKLILEEVTKLPWVKYTRIYDGRLYALIKHYKGNESESGLVSYRLGENGELSDKSEIIPTGAEGACHLDINENGIYVAHYYSGSVSLIRNGRLVKNVKHEGHSVDIFRQTHPYAHFVKAMPDGNLLVCDLGCDEVVVYDPELVRLGTAKTPAGVGPRHLVLSPNGKTVWVLSEMGSTLTRMEYADGVLTAYETLGLYPDRMRELPHTKSAAIRVSNDGETIYTSNRGFDVISIIDVSSGSARLRGEVSSEGGSPRDFNISPDGKYLVCANEASGASLFDFDRKCPRYLSSVALELPLAVEFFNGSK